MRNLGHTIAPPRFILFVLIFAGGLAAGIPTLGLAPGTMAGFDIAALAFLIVLTPLLGRGEARQMRQASQDNDANRAVLLGFSAVVLLVILVAVTKEMQGRTDTVVVTLSVVTLVLAWLFANTIYALHYAHLYYLPKAGGKPGEDAGGICFPGDDDEPDYWDFLYFSYTLGMTFQTSDVEIASGDIRRIVIGQCLAAFVFNLGVLAFSINVLGGG